MIAGVFTTVIVVLVLLGASLNSSRVNTYEDAKTSLENPLTQTKYSQISTGKACQINEGCKFDAAIFIGGINENSVDLAIKYLDENPKLTTVCLGSWGGEIQAATKLSAFIIERGLSTCMAEYFQLTEFKNEIVYANYCSSSCNQIFLASKKRISVGSNVRFKGHSYSKGATHRSKFLWTDWELVLKRKKIVSNEEFKKAIKSLGSVEQSEHIAYAELVAGVSHFDEMKVLNSEELKTYKIFTDYQ